MASNAEQRQTKVAAEVVANADSRKKAKEMQAWDSMHSGNQANDEAGPLVQATPRKNVTKIPNMLDIPINNFAKQESSYEKNVERLMKQWVEDLFVSEETLLDEETPEKEVPNNPDPYKGLQAIHLRKVEQSEERDPESLE